MGLTETLHYLILTWPLVLCTVFFIFPLYSVVLNIFVFLILTHMLLSTCSYFTPHWEIWDHLKGRIFHFLHFGFSEFFIHFFTWYSKEKPILFHSSSLTGPEQNYTLETLVTDSFLASSFSPDAWLTLACLLVFRVAVTSVIDFLLVHLSYPSLKEAVICSLLCPSHLT